MRINIIKFFIIGIGMLLFVNSDVLAQVSVNLPTYVRAPGSASEWINVSVDNLTGHDISAFQFTLSYNKNVIFIDSAICGTMTEAGLLIFNADTANQQIKVAYASSVVLSGSGTLVQLKVHYINLGTSPLAFDSTFKFNAGTPIANVTEGSIIIAKLPEKVMLIYPASNSIYIPVTVNFEWFKSQDQYWLELTTDTTSVSYVINDSTLTDTTKQVTGLKNLTEYWWRVKAMNAAGWGAFTDWSRFTTITDTPGVAILLSPNNNSIIIDTVTSILFKWDAAPFASTYELQIASDNKFNAVIEDTNKIRDTLFTYHINNLTSTFYWRVRGTSIVGTGPWSSVMTVSLISGIDNLRNSMPVAYELYQNYPNPFNPSTTISYALPFSSNVKIEVYNILGEKIKELVRGQKNAGYYEVNFNTTGLASGVYLYLIEAKSSDGKSDFRETKKMVLLK